MPLNAASKRAVRICGTGVALPVSRVSSDDIDRELGLSVGTIASRYGIATRYRAEAETAADLAVAACEAALNNADLKWDDIDCLVAANATMDQALPYNAAMVLAAAGVTRQRITAFDVGASCLSFLTAFDTVSYLVTAGRFRHILIVSADIASVALDWSKLGSSAIFGDGAAAAVIRQSEPDESSAILASRFEVYPDTVDACQIKAGGSRYHPRRAKQDFELLTLFDMDGKRLFKAVSKRLPAFVDELLAEAEVTASDLHCVVPHQASRLAIDHMQRKLEVDAAHVVDVFSQVGNQVAASLPFALHHAVVTKPLKRGDTVLLIGTGAGVTIGGIVMVY